MTSSLARLRMSAGMASRSGKKPLLLEQRQIVDLAAVIFGVRAGDGVAGHGHEGDVAGIDEAGRQHGQGGLGADGVVDFGFGIERDAEDLLHEIGGRFLEGGDAVVGVAAIFEPVDLALAGLADERIGHVVVFADAEIEQGAFGMGGQDGPLGPFDLLELVNFGALAVIGAADAVGEQGLKPGILRGAHGVEPWVGVVSIGATV